MEKRLRGIQGREKGGGQAKYLEAVDKDPSYAPALNSLGRLAGEQHDSALEESYYSKAIAKQPNYAPALNNLAIVAEQRGDIAKAAELENRAVKAAPNDPDYRAYAESLNRRLNAR